jgi:chemotaxis protein methyltransferase CheR
MQDSDEDITFKEYLQILKDHSPYDFSEYSDNSIARRIHKVMRDYRLTLNELILKTKSENDFVEEIVEAITVNTTELFRDPPIWSYVLQKLLPTLKTKTNINIWHAGCSTGQEVYSNLILLDQLGFLDRTTVYASDINQKVIEQAQKGVYKYRFNQNYIENFNQVHNTNQQVDFSKYFDIVESDDKLIVKDYLRSIPKFVKHDLVQEKLPFYIKFDIIFCRNVLIYFNAGLQSKIIQRFYDNLYPGGTMILGTHETLTGFFKTKFIKNGPVYSKSNLFHLKY